MTLRLVIGAVALTAFAACGERPQTAQAPLKKLDTPAASGANNAYVAPGWKAGDAASWEQQMKSRVQGQNEYSRIAGS
jgi:hypothetical protein